jgi:hypothetical protein
VAGPCEYGDEPSGSGATELVSRRWKEILSWLKKKDCCDKPGIHLVRIETASCGNGYEPSDSL